MGKIQSKYLNKILRTFRKKNRKAAEGSLQGTPINRPSAARKLKNHHLGLFITFEGGDGSGKTIQSNMLYERLLKDGLSVILTREPGGTPGSEEIRKLLLIGHEDKWGAEAESLLYLAARADHWKKVIEPALQAGKIVLVDRFQDSSLVYQGYCKEIPKWFLDNAYKMITGGRLPNRTYVFDIDPQLGIKRSTEKNGNEEVRFENMNIKFHEKVRQGFLQLASAERRFRVFDGSKSTTELADAVYQDFLNI